MKRTEGRCMVGFIGIGCIVGGFLLLFLFGIKGGWFKHQQFEEKEAASEHAAIHAEKEILMYSKARCPYCQAAKRLLQAKGVQFREIDISFDAQARAQMLRKSHGRFTVPQIFIGTLHVGGFDDLQLLEESGELETLLEGVE